MYFAHPFGFYFRGTLPILQKLSIYRRRFLFCMIPDVNFLFMPIGTMDE